jgi:hypothetical protein
MSLIRSWRHYPEISAYEVNAQTPEGKLEKLHFLIHQAMKRSLQSDHAAQSC